MATRKSRAGFVYIAESVRPDGSVKLYVGMTGRPIHERVAEHIREVETQNRRTWCGRGRSFRLLGWRATEDRFRLEREIKRKSAEQKKKLALEWTLERANKH